MLSVAAKCLTSGSLSMRIVVGLRYSRNYVGEHKIERGSKIQGMQMDIFLRLIVARYARSTLMGVDPRPVSD